MGNKNCQSIVDLAISCEWLLFSSEPDHIRGLKYSNSHHVYTNDLSKLSNIPCPGQLNGRKSDILRRVLRAGRRRDNIQNGIVNHLIAESIFSDYGTEYYRGAGGRNPYIGENPESAYKTMGRIGQTLNKKSLKQLVEALTKGLNNDLTKARAVYRWLTIQPIRAIERSSSEVDKNTPQYLLQLIENQITYAQLFSILCGMVGVPCVVISGFAKGSTYEVGEKLTRKHRAEWNAVLINEIWWLVDPFWGACEMVGKSRTEMKYSFDEYYFLTDPEHFIYTHFPEVSEWQLLDKPISKKEFKKQACLRQRFFELDMKLLADPLCCLETKDGDVSFVFGLNPQRSKQQTFRCFVTGIEPNTKQSSNDMKKKTDDNNSNRNNNSTLPFPAANVNVKLVEENDEKHLKIRISFQEVGKYKVEIVGKEGRVNNTDNEFDWIAIFRVHVKKTNRNNSMQDDEIKSVSIETRQKEEQPESDLVKTYLQTELVKNTKAEEEMKKKEQMANEIDTLRKAIHNAMKSKQLDQLESAVGKAIEKGYTEELGVEITEAKEAIDRMKRLQKLMQGVLELNQKTIAEIRSYSNPPEEVYKVMKATLLLLGNYEDETKEWKNVQALIGKTGKISLKRRVTEFDIESLQLDVALGSKQILEGIQFETVCATSSGAAAFFSWVTGIISEMEQKYANNVASTIPRTTKS